MTVLDWVHGDHLGLKMPAHVAALRSEGATFLTDAFRASGVISADNSVTAITRLEQCSGGSTGRKYHLAIQYAKPAADLHSELFIKFSRDFDDRIRDQGKDQLEAEVRFALLSRSPGFPIIVPVCYFADYHAGSGTGMLITQSIPFGQRGLEPLYEKCLDYKMPESLAHYRAIISSLGKLAGTHKSGGIEESVAKHFPYDAARQSLNQPIRYTQEQLQRRVERLSEFVAQYSKLLPANISSPAFVAQLAREIPLFLQHEIAIKQYLQSQPDYIALIHWNANVDNAWFWRDAAGELRCGLLDWGNVSQMNIGLALWGALSAAETALWDDNLEILLVLFIDAFRSAGGPPLDIEALKRQIFFAATMMSLSWLMDAPAMIRRQLPDLVANADRLHPAVAANETARTQLLMFTNFLNLWQRYDFGGMLQQWVKRQ